MIGNWKSVFILCEGQTEETFCNALLKRHFVQFNIDIKPHLLETSSGHKGGFPVYSKLKRQINKHKMSDDFYLTTFFDYYGLPNDFPGKNKLSEFTESPAKCHFLEQELERDINRKNFIPNIVLHEFETLLFSDLDSPSDYFSEEELQNLKTDTQGFSNPEVINDSPLTAPSKRILKIKEDYDKVFDGNCRALEIGLQKIRAKCPHFNSWIEKLENL
ncbi:MAG TPA: DUF4276 family protein [Thermotogota bacterium]|nr:DUF4276 family protein [Thermotogota bacterium]